MQVERRNMMRKRLVCSALCCVVLLVTASTAAASQPRMVTGDFTFESPPFWFIEDPQIQGWMQISARETGPEGEARGWWRVQLYKESFGGWRCLDGRVVQLEFGELHGDPVVAILVQITHAEGWGTEGPDADPKIGEYGWSMLHDGGPHGWLHPEGTHGSQSDDYVALQYHSMDPLDEYFPDRPAEFGLWDPGEWVIDAIDGNVTIHGM
jgi:hypothetical protein